MAVQYNFDCITNNNATNCTTGEAQLVVDVDPNGTQVDFKFSNKGPNASSITDVYFADGTLLGIATITDGPGVNFSEGANPGNLPGGASIFPAFTAKFSADSDAPPPINGVNPGESLTITFDLINGKTFADTIAALGNGDLRIGIHVQSFSNGGSESFVHVPEPGFYGLLSMGLAGLYVVVRRRRVNS
jgi:hypothetical protein